MDPAASELILTEILSGSANDLSFLDFAVPDAGHADPNGPVRALDHGMHPLQVRKPPALGEVMGVADPVPAHRLFAAQFTHLSHGDSLPRLGLGWLRVVLAWRWATRLQHFAGS